MYKIDELNDGSHEILRFFSVMSSSDAKLNLAVFEWYPIAF